MPLKSRYSRPVWLASGVRTPFSKVDGALASHDAIALSAALMGAVEAMVRERLLAKRGGNSRPFSYKQLHKIFGAMLNSFK